LARTLSEWAPVDSPFTSYGDSHDPYVAPSSEHSNVAVGSFVENVKLAVVAQVGCSGPVSIVVVGASTVQP
jgi:hypothetical protein